MAIIKLYHILSILISISICNSNDNEEEEFLENKFNQIQFSEKLYLENKLNSYLELDIIGTLNGSIIGMIKKNIIWDVSIGKPLLNIEVDLESILQTTQIFPAYDNYLYLSESGKVKKTGIDINLNNIKELVEKSPFTFPNIGDFIYIGNKETKLITLDLLSGRILSDTSNKIKDRYDFNSVKAITIIRTDYFISSIEKSTGKESWSLSISEITFLNINQYKKPESKIEENESHSIAIRESREESILDQVKTIKLNVNNEKVSIKAEENNNSLKEIQLYDEIYFDFLNEYFKFLKIKIKNGQLLDKDLDMSYLTQKWINIKKDYLKKESQGLIVYNNYNRTSFNNTNSTIFNNYDHDLIQNHTLFTRPNIFNIVDESEIFINEHLYDRILFEVGVYFIYFKMTNTILIYIISVILLLLVFILVVILLLSYKENKKLRLLLQQTSSSLLQLPIDNICKSLVPTVNNQIISVSDCLKFSIINSFIRNSVNRVEKKILIGDEEKVNNLTTAIVKKSNSVSTNVTIPINSVFYNIIDEGRLNKTFTNLEQIGKGGFGLVLKAKHIIDENYYAIKIIKLKIDKFKDLASNSVIKEVKTMIKLNHKNVVRYTTCWFQSQLEGLENIIDINQSLFKSENLDTSKSVSISVHKSNAFSFKNPKLGSKTNIYENSERNDVSAGIVFNKSNTTLNDYFYSKSDEEESKSKGKNLNLNLNLNIWEDSKAISEVHESIHEENTLIKSKTKSSNPKTNSFHSNESIKEVSRITIKKIEEEVINNHQNNSLDNSEILSVKRENTFQPSFHMKIVLYFFMQMEFCDGLPLNLFLESKKHTGMERKQIFSFFKQIVVGVNHMHKNKVIHRDLK